MGLGPISAVSRRQQVLDAVRQGIIDGSLAPGEQLKQDQLAHELGVSPVPVREALRQLESEGLVEHRPNRGVFVSHISLEELYGVLLPVRLTLESYAAEQVLDRLTDDDVAELTRLIDVMRRGAADDDLIAINEADLRFHEHLVQASGAPHTIQLWRSVHSRVRTYLYRVAPRHDRLDEIADEHRDLLTALLTRDRETVRAALHEHIVTTTRTLIDG